MVAHPSLAILFDVDNTLLDNDAAKLEMASRLVALVGAQEADRFWRLYEHVRQEIDLVDIPLTISRFSEGLGQTVSSQVNSVFFDLPFAEYLYPCAPGAIHHANALGTVGIVSDGDQTFQKHKIVSSGLGALVNGLVVITRHKERELDDVFAELSADRYVMVDDKPRILAALRRTLGDRIVTVFVRQGKYAHAENAASYGNPDITLESIEEFTTLAAGDLRA